MRYRYLCVSGLCLLLTVPYAMTQDKMTTSKLFQHILRLPGPEYPAAAKAACVQGVVVLQVRVGIDGKVESVQTVSGPSMLVQAAKDSVKQWTFRPFEKNGAPVEVVGDVSVSFMLQGEKPIPPPTKLSANSHPSVIVVHLKAQPVTPEAAVAEEFRKLRSECAEKLKAQNGQPVTEEE